MANNPEAVKVIQAVGQTPGFKVEHSGDGSFKLIRLPIPEHGVQSGSVKMYARAHGRNFENACTRLRRLGWTDELFEECQRIERECRMEGGDPGPELEKILLKAFDVDPADSSKDTPEQPKKKIRRHAKGTPTGSAKAPKPQAVPAQPSAPEAEQKEPVRLVEGAGEIRAEIITPERAVELLLNLAPYQRDLKKKKVQDYAAAMRRGEWLLNPADPLCIDTNGQTANGQHRLEAILAAEKELAQTPEGGVPMYVAYGVPPKTYRVMDRGTKRSTADMLHGAGEVNTASLASTARLAHRWFVSPGYDNQEEWRNAPEVTDAQVFSILEDHPNLRESVRLGRMGGGLKVSPSASMFAHYLCSRKCGGDPRIVTRWFKAIADVDLDRGQPGHSLALYFLKAAPSANRRTSLHGRTRMELDLYLLLKAWNNTAQGKEQRQVGWKATFTIPQPIAPTSDHKFPPLD